MEDIRDAVGMTQGEADTISWRGTDEGTQMKIGGGSGLNMPFTGARYPNGAFNYSSRAYLWSSLGSSTVAWRRSLDSILATIRHDTLTKTYGVSIRCLGD